MSCAPLTGRTIAIPETRELDLFAGMLERRGASVLRCPLVAIRDAPDFAVVLQWIRQFSSGGCDDLVLLTGEGLRRLLSCIEQHEPQLRAAFVAQLARVRKITRGPKPARALRDLGMKPDIAAEVPTTDGVIAALRAEHLAGRRVGVQLAGPEPNPTLVGFLESAGATVSSVAPYTYAGAADERAVREMLERLQAGTVDAIAFTSAPQVERLFASAAPEVVRSALSRTLVAAVGPVVAAALSAHGVHGALMPTESFFLKPLTSALEQALAPR